MIPNMTYLFSFFVPADETVPLANVFNWALPLDVPVVVVPGADHFFHRRLHQIRDIVTRAWRH